MRLDKDFLILHADIVRNNLLYWVDGLNNARKTNINKLFDQTENGYGPTILESFINAYKRTADFAPTVVYFSDTTKKFNNLYGALRRFATRFIYDDGEKSNWSDFSAIATPDKEPFIGVNVIPTNNNGLKITFETGDRTVVKIEIAMQSTNSSANESGFLDWKLIATLNKRRLSINDNSVYTYSFYNDADYPVTAYEKIIRPYGFLPKQPLCQSVTKSALVYSGGKEGFPVVDVDASTSVVYNPLFIEDGVENEYNDPEFIYTNNGPSGDDYVSGSNFGNIRRYDDTVEPFGPGFNNTPVRFKRITLTIGNDVKKGNKFILSFANGFAGDNFTYEYIATLTDTAVTVANAFKSYLISTGRIYRKTPDLPDTSIYDNTIDGEGNVTFSFIIKASRDKNYLGVSQINVEPVQFDTLKDTGQSVKNIKLGSSIKLGIEYEDFDGRKSGVYTIDALIVAIDTINDLGGIKSPVITLQINHTAPIWAKYYQVVRSFDLVYKNYIQMLIQNVIEVQSTTTTEYLDLVVGSLFTYNKIHPNSNLGYDFKKGDRIRLIKKTSDDTYYPFFETEILSYNPIVTEDVKTNITTDGTATVAVASGTAKADNIGRSILIEGSEREIIDVPTPDTYLLNAPIGESTAKTYLFFQIIDIRGTIRIRKPSSPISLLTADKPLVEIFSPSSESETDTSQFFEFQKKFAIINPGTENAYHSANKQNQTQLVPALVEISEGTAYVRNREQPLTNNVPGAQVEITPIEDPSYSDFYFSLINDNGRANAEDLGIGEITFGNRMRYSNNSIEDTQINGLNDFDNTDREDYPDKYGIIKRTVFDKNNIYVFKELRSCFVPVFSKLTADDNGNLLRAGTTKLLNPIQYMAYEGGIGNNPEAYCSNGTHKYVVYPNAGVIIRIGGNGEEPISETFNLNFEVREVLANAAKNKAKIFLGFNRKLGLLCVHIEGFNQYIYFDGFTSWITSNEIVPNDTLFEIVDSPSNGTIDFTNGYQWTYTPNTNYLGPDDFSYRAFVDGQWLLPTNVCLNVIETPNRITAWRPKESSYNCLKDDLLQNTGYKEWSILEEYYIDDLSVTGNEKPNVPSDSDYASPIFDPTKCPSDPPPPVCPDRVLVIQICNSNASIDDNFDVYLNDILIGQVDLNANAQVGSVFIASLGTPEIFSSDFTCPIADMDYYYFDPAIVVGGTNTVKMINIQNNGNSNQGSVGVRNYLLEGDELALPCVVSDLSFIGPSGSNFELSFTYDECCPEDE